MIEPNRHEQTYDSSTLSFPKFGAGECGKRLTSFGNGVLGGGLIARASPSAAKKSMGRASGRRRDQAADRLDCSNKKCSASTMPTPPAQPSRRDVLAGFGGLAGALAAGPSSSRADAGATAALGLRLAAAEATLRGALPASPVWDFIGGPWPLLRQDDSLDLTLTNDLPVPVLLDWRSCDGTPAVEPLLVQRPLQPGQTSTLRLALTQAGTVLCDARLLGDGLARPLPATGLAVLERHPPTVDADRLVTITDWRVRPDGSVVAPGVALGDATTVFTANGVTALDLVTRAHSRLRLRFINACHRSPIALKIDDHDLRVVAIDGLPASPFSARDGQLVLAPGTRLDAFVDATGRPGTTSAIWLHDRVSVRRLGQLVYEGTEPLRPAPLGPSDALTASALPERLALSSARRVELAVDGRAEGATATWSSPSAFTTATPPLFQVKRGATVVLALLNRGAAPVTFHLHGHRVRWLDRLDDGWKPFWLDTLLVPGNQTVRVAFLAEHVGPWMIEMMGTDWTAPRLVHWYAVS